MRIQPRRRAKRSTLCRVAKALAVVFAERLAARRSVIRPAISSTPIEATLREPRRGSRSWSRWKRWASKVRGWRSPTATIASKRSPQRAATVSKRSRGEAGTRPFSSAAIRSSRARRAATTSVPAVRKCSRPPRHQMSSRCPRVDLRLTSVIEAEDKTFRCQAEASLCREGLTGRHLNHRLRNRIKALHGGTPTRRQAA